MAVCGGGEGSKRPPQMCEEWVGELQDVLSGHMDSEDLR